MYSSASAAQNIRILHAAELSAERALGTPVTWIERIDFGARRLRRFVHPDGRERKALLTIEFDPPGNAERAIDRENLARGT